MNTPEKTEVLGLTEVVDVRLHLPWRVTGLRRVILEPAAVEVEIRHNGIALRDQHTTAGSR